MLLCLDIGNTHILGGVFDQARLVLRFRYATSLLGTADQFGIFLINLLQFHQLDLSEITAVAMSSVVPHCDYTLQQCFSRYFKIEEPFILKSGVQTELNIRCTHVSEVGADRIANAIGAIDAFPDQSLIVVDMGTATTLCTITKNKDYLGGAILPGLRLCMEALKNNTAKLMAVDIEPCTTYIGKTTRENIQNGLYYGHLGALKEIIQGFRKEFLGGESAQVIGTGGFAQLYKEKGLFDFLSPNLVLNGLNRVYKYRQMIKK